MWVACLGLSFPTYQGVTKHLCYKKETLEPGWWHIPVVLALGKHRQMDFCELKASLIYVVRSGLARNTQ